MKDLFFIGVLPPVEIGKKIDLFKVEMSERYQAKHALKLPAHITLQIPFRIMREQENDLISCLGSFAEGECPFEVKLSGFGCFSPRVIYVKIADPEPWVKIQKGLQKILGKTFPEIGLESKSSFHPHVTIASRDLDKKKFPKAWQDFKERKFNQNFFVGSFWLFKHNGKSWDQFHRFDFKSV